MKPYGIIYLITNKVNEKCYVGQTVESLQKRWGRHCFCAMKRNKKTIKFHNAIKKYGPDNFDQKILCECYSIKELNNMEISMIKTHHSHISENGYNMTFGGEGTPGKKHTEEAKRKMSETRKGKYCGKNNPMYGKTGEKSYWFGKKHTEETKEKMRKNMKGIKRTPEQCLNISLAKRGYVPSEDTKAKLRITTSGENNGNAKNYKIILPDGTTKIIKCLRVFCSENNLNYASANYHSKSGTPYKNYIIEKVIK